MWSNVYDAMLLQAVPILIDVLNETKCVCYYLRRTSYIYTHNNRNINIPELMLPCHFTVYINTFHIKTDTGVIKSLSYHVNGSIDYLKIVDNATATILRQKSLGRIGSHIAFWDLH